MNRGGANLSRTDKVVADVELNRGSIIASNNRPMIINRPILNCGRFQAAISILPFTECQKCEVFMAILLTLIL